MSATLEFFKAWLRENVGTLAVEDEISIPVLARQFEQDADAAGYGVDVREDEIGNIENAIAEELEASQITGEAAGVTDDLHPVVEALETDDEGPGSTSDAGPP